MSGMAFQETKQTLFESWKLARDRFTLLKLLISNP